MYIYVQGDVYIMLRKVYISSFIYRLAWLCEYKFRLCARVCVYVCLCLNVEAKVSGNFKMKHVFIKLRFCSGINLIMDFLCLNIVESKLLLIVLTLLRTHGCDVDQLMVETTPAIRFTYFEYSVW
jgi:hypothetical protein